MLLFLVVDAPALAAAPQLGGASVQTSKSVKITFTGPVSSSATALSHYAVSPALGLSSATLTDSGYSVLLVTGTQTNGLAYTVTVSGVTGTDGTPLLGSPSTVFIGTTLGANTTTSAKDDFNRPFGLIKTDLPIPGPWLSKDISTKNSMGLVGGPTFAGSGALYSHVSDTDPEKDNALVRYATSGKDYYLSAYIYIPSGQKWGSDQEIGLIRMMQSLYTSHARVSAMDQSSSSFYALNVNWKTTGNKYLGPQTVVTGIPFDTWHWIEMHIKDGTSTTKGEVQVWVDGRLSYEQGGIYVYPASMTYAQVGIMHLVTSGPAATTITDEVRFGSAFQLPVAALRYHGAGGRRHQPDRRQHTGPVGDDQRERRRRLAGAARRAQGGRHSRLTR